MSLPDRLCTRPGIPSARARRPTTHHHSEVE